MNKIILLSALLLVFFFSAGNSLAVEKICTMQYAPVCGVDGVTYGNACMAGEVKIVREGECQSVKCNIQCFRYDPVCGVDGKTYGCGLPDATCHGAKIAYSGECKITKPEITCALSDLKSRQLCLMLKEKEIFENYLKVNISKLSKTKAVLGGEFYITEIKWQANRVAIVSYEDGHIALKAKTQVLPLEKSRKVVGARIKYFKILK